MLELDGNTLGAVGALALGLGGGIGLIVFTENAGKRNEEVTLAQPCVSCKEKSGVVECTVCKGTGTDPLAELVAGVQDVAGEASASTVTVEDWDSGPRQVELYSEILSKYPVLVTEAICNVCDGRGVVVCDNCQGTGLQPRFLERYSPDDFMD